jgi:hypothetical protein
MKPFYYILLLSFSWSVAAPAQQRRIPSIPLLSHSEDNSQAARLDSLKALLPRPKIKPYDAVITNHFSSQQGMFTVHRSHDTTYFEIPDSLLHRDLMLVNRLSRVPGGVGMYAGEAVDEQTLYFEMGPDSTIQIRYDLVISEADSTSAIYRSVEASNNNPVVASFPVLTFGKDHHSYVIDVTRWLKEKNLVNNINPASKLAEKVNLNTQKEYYVQYIHVYPINVEIATSRNTELKGGLTGRNEPATIETICSFIELPGQPMQRRYFDPRVGYFADEYYAYGDDQQKSEIRHFILRWRLEPKEEDMEKWKRGELVEPKKPIVIYIDPATPKQWRPYLVQGINDWQPAFEQAGFRNAIIGKEWPENDSTMHPDDARYSVLNYFASDISNAYGPNVHDPRSGEIIQTHIGWYHNVMTILHDWYMIQAGALDPRARKATFDTELMGQLIRFVSSHEVGHTLGLRHNFGSSSQTPVDSLRSKHWLDAHGHTASIMDYARFNYVAQPEDHLTEQELFPHIGEYDRWAIEWGYKHTDAPNAEEDKKVISKWIVERLAKNPLLWFGDGETRKFDPRCQTEDLGDDPIKASDYGIKNLKRILPNLPAWTQEEDGINISLAGAYKALTDQYARYLNHVLKNIGGVYYTIRSETEKAPDYEPDPKRRQVDALAFFNAQLFTTPTWLLDPLVVDKVSLPSSPSVVEDLQVKVLNSLLDIARINNLLEYEKRFGTRALPAAVYFEILHHDIWRELKTAGPVVVDPYRRGLQKAYFGCLFAIVSDRSEDSEESDASSLAKADLYMIRQEITAALPRITDVQTLIHLRDIENRIKQLSDHKND